MYWFLSINIVNLASYILLSLAWAAGGWLLCASLFPLKPFERLACGVAAGWLLFITLSNLLAPRLTLVGGSWTAAFLILLAGLAAAWRKGKPLRLPWSDFKNWPQLAWLVGLTGLFELIQRGLAIFDEFQHLPLVSALAAGDIPPHFALNPAQEFAYHYGLQIWAAGMVRLANATPWFAWDLARAFALALTVVCAWVWSRRWTRNGLVAAAGSFLITFGGGIFWLLLAFPKQIVQAITSSSQLVNAAVATAPTIADSLTKTWALDGGGPFPFPFAFINGIFMPTIFSFANTGAMVFVTVLLMLLLAFGKRVSWFSAMIVGLLLASLALSAEHLFFFLWVGLAIALVISAIRAKSWRERNALRWWAALGLSGLLSLVQGGYITVVFHKVLGAIFGVAASTALTETISLRWPPAIVSQKFGALSVLDPGQLVLIILDIGPVLLLIPIIFYLTRKWIQRDNWLPAGLGLASFFCFVIPAFIQYGVEPSMVRFPDTAAWLWLFLGIPPLVYWLKKVRGLGQTLLGISYFMTVFSGIVVFAVQLIAIQSPQISYYLRPIDGIVAQQYWDRLEPGAQVLTLNPSISVAVFGREVVSNSSTYVELPIWIALGKNPDPALVAKAGYDYIYMDQGWWSSLTFTQQAALKDSCVKSIAHWQQPDSFRELLDVTGCK